YSPPLRASTVPSLTRLRKPVAGTDFHTAPPPRSVIEGGADNICSLRALRILIRSCHPVAAWQNLQHRRGDIMSALAPSRAVSILVCSFGIAAVLVGDAASQGSSQGSSSRPLVSEAQFEAWQTELSNWGRWGKDDELGTLNLITPAKRMAALALVKEGVPVSLSTNTSTEKAVDVPCPAEWAMTSSSQ